MALLVRMYRLFTNDIAYNILEFCKSFTYSIISATIFGFVFQYNRLSEDWRQFNNLVWGIPTIAVAIMGGIVVAAYQPELVGWPHFAVLLVGSIFLLVLMLEVAKKRLHMTVISYILKELQMNKDGLGLEEWSRSPSGLRIPMDGNKSYDTYDEYHRKNIRKYEKDRLSELNPLVRLPATRILGIVILLGSNCRFHTSVTCLSY